MRSWIGFATVSMLLAGVLLGAAPAYAHASLLSSDPADEARLASPPSEVTLTFSERIDPRLAKTAVTVAGEPVSTSPRTRGATVIVSVDAGAGRYRVAYRVVSMDGHPVEGTITFTVTSADGAAAAPSASPSVTSTRQSDSAAVVDPTTDTKGRTVPRSAIWLVVGLGGLGLVLALGYVLTIGRKRPAPGGSASLPQGQEDSDQPGPLDEPGHAGEPDQGGPPEAEQRKPKPPGAE